MSNELPINDRKRVTGLTLELLLQQALDEVFDFRACGPQVLALTAYDGLELGSGALEIVVNHDVIELAPVLQILDRGPQAPSDDFVAVGLAAA